MLERPDAILAAVPILAVSGLVIQAVIETTGVATGLLAAPLAPAGYLAALALVFGELLVDPAVRKKN